MEHFKIKRKSLFYCVLFGLISIFPVSFIFLIFLIYFINIFFFWKFILKIYNFRFIVSVLKDNFYLVIYSNSIIILVECQSMMNYGLNLLIFIKRNNFLLQDTLLKIQILWRKVLNSEILMIYKKKFINSFNYFSNINFNKISFLFLNNYDMNLN